jgi:hypothetical protein
MHLSYALIFTMNPTDVSIVGPPMHARNVGTPDVTFPSVPQLTLL